MKRKIVIGSILAAVLIVLASLTSVVGTTSVISNVEKTGVVSPLFALRAQRITNNENENKINFNYIGKGKTLNLGFQTKTTYNILVNKAFKIIENNPKIFNNLLAKLEKNSEILNILNSNNIDLANFKREIAEIKENPFLLKQKYEEAEQVLRENLELPLNAPSEPLGLIDQWQPGVLILALILLPVLIIIGFLVATILIITCIIPQCLVGVIEAVVIGIIQGLRQPNPLCI